MHIERAALPFFHRHYPKMSAWDAGVIPIYRNRDSLLSGPAHLPVVFVMASGRVPYLDKGADRSRQDRDAAAYVARRRCLCTCDQLAY